MDEGAYKGIDMGELQREMNGEYRKIKATEAQEKLDALTEAHAFRVMATKLSGQRPGYGLVIDMHQAGVPIDRIERDMRFFRDSCMAAFNRITIAIRIIKEREGGGR